MDIAKTAQLAEKSPFDYMTNNLYPIPSKEFHSLLKQEFFAKTIQLHVIARLAEENKLNEIPTFNSINLYLLTSVGINKDQFKKDAHSVLCQLGFVCSDDSFLLFDKQQFMRTASNILQFNGEQRYIFNLRSGRLNDELTDDQLLVAIRDHLGHGVSVHLPEDVLKESMREEGRTDRAAARKLWEQSLMPLYRDPSVTSLSNFFEHHESCGEWRDNIYALNAERHGPFVAGALQWLELWQELCKARLDDPYQSTSNDPFAQYLNECMTASILELAAKEGAYVVSQNNHTTTPIPIEVQQKLEEICEKYS